MTSIVSANEHDHGLAKTTSSDGGLKIPVGQRLDDSLP